MLDTSFWLALCYTGPLYHKDTGINEPEGLNITASCERYLRHILKSRPSEFPNKPIHARISIFSEETHLWDILTSPKCIFFMLYTHEFRGISYCRPWPAREKQHLVLQLVSNEQDSCAILNLTIRVVGWIEGFLDTRFLIWHHYEDVIQLIHLHYIVRYAVAGGRKIFPEV